MSNCKYETSNGRCGLKGSYAYRHKCYTEDMCRCHEPKTNADHIRSMTDEELAVFLEGFGVCHYCPEYEEASFVAYGIPDCDGDCERHILDWLKQPYKEDT